MSRIYRVLSCSLALFLTTACGKEGPTDNPDIEAYCALLSKHGGNADGCYLKSKKGNPPKHTLRPCLAKNLELFADVKLAFVDAHRSCGSARTEGKPYRFDFQRATAQGFQVQMWALANSKAMLGSDGGNLTYTIKRKGTAKVLETLTVDGSKTTCDAKYGKAYNALCRSHVAFEGQFSAGDYVVEAELSVGSLNERASQDVKVEGPSAALKSERKSRAQATPTCTLVLSGPDGATLSSKGERTYFKDGKADLQVTVFGAQNMSLGGQEHPLTAQPVKIELALSAFTFEGSATMFQGPSAHIPVSVEGERIGSYRGRLTCTEFSFRVGGPRFKVGKAYRLPGEGEARSGKHIAALVSSKRVKMKGRVHTVEKFFGGEPESAKDVDFYVVADDDYVKVGSCAYKGKKTGRTKNIDRVRHDIALTIYDRRSGASLATKNFKGSKPICRNEIQSSTKGTYGGVMSTADRDRWITQALTKLR